MGSSSSTRQVQAGGLIIYVDTPNLHPGDVVTGNVYIEMTQSFSTSCLLLTLKVNQHTEFRYEDESSSERNSKKLKGEKILFNSAFILAKFPQNLISPGQYQFPFNFRLPENLPGSFEYYDDINVAYTTYILEAKLPAVHSNNEIKNSSLIVVNEHIKNLGITKYTYENSSNLISYCCLPQGESTLQVFIPRDSFFTDDKIIANCDFNNIKCKLNGTNLIMTLMQSIVLRDNYGRAKHLSRTISKINFRKFYPKRENSKVILELPILDFDNPSQKYMDKCDHLDLIKNNKLVTTLQASVKSDLINCTYILKLKAFYDGHLMTSKTPEVYIPVALHIPDIRVDINTYMPTVWNPNLQALTKFEFPLPTAEELGIQVQKEVITQI